jgi:hypothetical protein
MQYDRLCETVARTDRNRVRAMTAPLPDTSPRNLVCARCGGAFECAVGGQCWCAAEPYRLPLTDAGAAEDCLCPACLRRAAVKAESGRPG